MGFWRRLGGEGDSVLGCVILEWRLYSDLNSGERIRNDARFTNVNELALPCLILVDKLIPGSKTRNHPKWREI